MTRFEIETEMGHLRSAFPRADFKEGEYNLWFLKFKHWSLPRFQKVIDVLVEQEDKFPSISKVLKAGASLHEDEIKRNVFHCPYCDSTGIVSASFEKGHYCFRCNVCRNWEGFYSEKIPVWSQTWHIQGYEMELSAATTKEPSKIDSVSSTEWVEDI